MDKLALTTAQQIATIQEQPIKTFEQFVHEPKLTRVDVLAKQSPKEVEAYIIATLKNLIEAVKVDDKISVSELFELADELINSFGYWKLPDFDMFVKKAKFGKLGKVYNRLDLMTVMEMAAKYDQQRSDYCANKAQSEKPILGLPDKLGDEKQLIENLKDFKHPYKAGISKMIKKELGHENI